MSANVGIRRAANVSSLHQDQECAVQQHDNSLPLNDQVAVVTLKLSMKR
jgi:hypothetical protein